MTPENLFMLMDAVGSRDVERALELIDAGASVRGVLSTGETLLHRAARISSPEMVRLLLDAGADVHAKTEWGATALSLAAGRKPSNDATEITRTLLAAGADPGPGGFDHSALHGAVYVCNIDTARLLMSAGADVNAVSGNGETPLIMAIGRAYRDDEAENGARHFALCELLTSAGANASFVPENATPDYLTSFQRVVSWGWLKWIDMFVKVGEDPCQCTLDGRTLLQIFPRNSGVKLQEAKELLNRLKTEFVVRQAMPVDEGKPSAPATPRGVSPL